MAELSEQQREDRQKAIQEIRDAHPGWVERYSDEEVANKYYEEMPIRERAVRFKRECDEAMRLIKWIRSRQIVEQMDRIDTFLAAHPANGGQDNG